MWSSLDVGLQFENASQLRSSLENLGIGGVRKKSSRPGDSSTGDRPKRNPSKLGNLFPLNLDGEEEETTEQAGRKDIDGDAANRTEPHKQFIALKAFYKEQLINTQGASGGFGLDSFSSPSSLTRILNLYNNPGSRSSRTAKAQQMQMREASNIGEGFILRSEIDEQPQIDADYIETVTPEQQAFQHPVAMGNPDAKHVSQLWPMSTKLRTKRAKRCAACKHILVKPEFKVISTRFRIKLIALNYIPLISLRPVPLSGGLNPPGLDGANYVLEPGKPSQWIMKLTNPLFEDVNVSLGSPSVTPGKHGHKVTILCPQFSIGKNGDVWDDALKTGGSTITKTISNVDGASEQIAGKVYESGRNWVSVVIEIVPSPIPRGKDREELDEDEDVIEIPIRVRLEWSVADDGGERVKKRSEKLLDDEVEAVDDGQRELAYWIVVGIGRVAT